MFSVTGPAERGLQGRGRRTSPEKLGPQRQQSLAAASHGQVARDKKAVTLVRERSGGAQARTAAPDTVSAAAVADRKHGEAAKEPRPDNNQFGVHFVENKLLVNKQAWALTTGIWHLPK